MPVRRSHKRMVKKGTIMEYLKPAVDSRVASELIQGAQTGQLDRDHVTLMPNDFLVSLED
jgi:hypothetical protein